MKKRQLTIFCLLTVIFIAAFTAIQYNNLQNQKDDIVSANVEALSEVENQNYSICYHESKVAVGYTYYDCGTCQKVYDEKGRKNYSKCFH